MMRLMHTQLICLFLCALSVHASDRPAGIPEEAKYAKVDRVYDGDTLVLMGGSRARIIRLDGIDAPERDQPYGPVATAALEYMVG